VSGRLSLRLPAVLRPDPATDGVVPPVGPTAWLTGFTAAAMAFLAVFALALALAAGRLADRWAAGLAQSATIRLSAPPEQVQAQVAAVLAVLGQTPGVAASRALAEAETRALLEPWFGPDLPLDALPVPRLIEVTEGSPPYDAEGLRQRLAAEAPGAVLDDHTRWRRPLVAAADRLRLLAALSLGLIGASLATMVTLAATAALAANGPVIRVLRLVGARDAFIARAFTRRFTLRALWGAAAGAMAGTLGVALLPAADPAGGFLTGLGFAGWGWLWPLVLPPAAAVTAFAATRIAAFRALRALP
jgi:cell division transport system permease protein